MSNASWGKFYSKGREEGFGPKEIKLLQELAQRSNASNPTALFWSAAAMDKCLKNLVQELNEKKIMDSPENRDFLARLFDFRKKIEMSKPRFKKGIKSSRELSSLQPIEVVDHKVGMFKSKVLAVQGLTLTIARPDSSALSLNFKWKGEHIVIYFWRKNDAGYCFESDVVEELFTELEVPILKIKHSDSLSRTQSRKSLRVKTHRKATLYTMGDLDEDEIAVVPRVDCMLDDLSDCGCSVVVKGNEQQSGMRVVVQFFLNKAALSISGVIRNIQYNKEKESSLLHIESDLISPEVKNLIMSLMFGALVDDVDTVPIDSDAEAAPEANEIVQTNEVPSTEGDERHIFDYSEGGVAPKAEKEPEAIKHEDFSWNEKQHQ
ncbi:MAG: hypothetical protein Ta2G_05590 [Termitinemataceae bacterium]|nr:MAG: hypothetical protein Ta2G_05590 [Termitinemataceae bacterium]